MSPTQARARALSLCLGHNNSSHCAFPLKTWVKTFTFVYLSLVPLNVSVDAKAEAEAEADADVFSSFAALDAGPDSVFVHWPRRSLVCL